MSPIVWVLVSTLFAALFGFVSIYDERRKRIWQTMVFLSAVVIFIAGVFAQKDQAQFEQQLNAKNKEIAEISKDLVRKSEEIVELNKQITASVTGGDSFCYITVLSNSSRELLRLLILHEGKYPLYDVQARIADLDDEKFKHPMTFETVFADKLINIGNVPPSMSLINPQWTVRNMSGSSLKRYNIFFTARNGYFTEQLRMAWKGDKWATAVRVRKADKTIFEEIDDDYPRNNRGEVDWTGH